MGRPLRGAVPEPQAAERDPRARLVTAGLVESRFIAIGLFSVLAVVSWQDASGVDPRLAETVALIEDWTFLLGPGFIVGLGNGQILAYLMYRSGLVPRQMAVLGLIGGPLIVASGIAVLFGVFEFGSLGQSPYQDPEFLWELSLGIYHTVKGFRPSPILSRHAKARPARVLIAGQAARPVVTRSL